MSAFRLAALVLLAAPFTSLAEPTPEAAPAAAAAAAPAPEAALPADPFTQHGRALRDVPLRSGPDALSPAKATLIAGTGVAVAPGLVRGFARVRVASGESGYVEANAIGEESAATAAAAPGVVPQPARPLAPPPPSAANRGRFIARAGFALPADDNLDGFDPGLALEIGLTGPLSPNVAAEVTVGWSRLSASESGVDIKFRSIPVLAGLRLVAPSPGMEMYLSVGGGFDLVGLSGSGMGVTVSDSGTAPIFQVGAGMSMPLRDGSRFELGLRYYAGKATLFDVEGGVDVTTVFLGWAL